MARSATTTDVFNAIGDGCRRQILTSLGGGESSVGELIDRLHLPQPQVSKHLKVLRDVGLVRCRTSGRHRLYRVNGAALRPIHEWTSQFEQLWNERFDRLDDLLVDLQSEHSSPNTLSPNTPIRTPSERQHAMSTRTGSAVVTLPTDTTILITRSFEAPVALVWETLTTPRHLLRWWGPTWCPLVSCEIDLRVGGSWRYLSRMDDGTELGWHGTYREIAPPHRIVSTEVFEGFPDAESLNTMTLTHVDGVTTLETLVQHASQEFRDGHIASGMEAGMQETFDRLDDLLDRSGSTAERFRRVAGRFTDRAREVAPEAWDNPAPCEGWVARDIVRHMVEWMPGLLSSAGVELAPIPSVDDDPVAAWTALADQLQGLLDDPIAAATEVDLGPAGHHTIESGIGMIMLGDVVVHTWDLAKATGLDATIDRDMSTRMLRPMTEMGDMLVASGHYKQAVPVPDDASVEEKLIASTGRDPAWPR